MGWVKLGLGSNLIGGFQKGQPKSKPFVFLIGVVRNLSILDPKLVQRIQENLDLGMLGWAYRSNITKMSPNLT